MIMTSATNKPIDALRTSPHWPKAAASIALFRDDAILLVLRTKPPRPGLWSLPGGHIEPGEKAASAAERELREETGLVAAADGLVDILDVIMHDDEGRLRAHYLLAVHYGRWREGEPHADSDAGDARFVRLGEIDEYPLTPGAKRLISQAWAKLTENH
jgi:ADP-ribose pyrophosphatase YjhB (NUDIX family)